VKREGVDHTKEALKRSRKKKRRIKRKRNLRSGLLWYSKPIKEDLGKRKRGLAICAEAVDDGSGNRGREKGCQKTKREHRRSEWGAPRAQAGPTKKAKFQEEGPAHWPID